MNMMKHKGYRAVINYDDSVDSFHGRVVGIRDVISFMGSSIAELKKEFEFSIDDYLSMCEERGEEPDKPCTGSVIVTISISPDNHLTARLIAESENKTLDAWFSEAIERDLQNISGWKLGQGKSGALLA